MIPGCDFTLDTGMIFASVSFLREVLQAILMSSSPQQCTEEWSIYATYALGLIQLMGVFYLLSVAFKNMFMIGMLKYCFVSFHPLVADIYPSDVHVLEMYAMLQWIFRA